MWVGIDRKQVIFNNVHQPLLRFPTFLVNPSSDRTTSSLYLKISLMHNKFIKYSYILPMRGMLRYFFVTGQVLALLGSGDLIMP